MLRNHLQVNRYPPSIIQTTQFKSHITSNSSSSPQWHHTPPKPGNNEHMQTTKITPKMPPCPWENRLVTQQPKPQWPPPATCLSPWKSAWESLPPVGPGWPPTGCGGSTQHREEDNRLPQSRVAMGRGQFKAGSGERGKQIFPVLSLWVGCEFVNGVWVCEWGVSLWVGCEFVSGVWVCEWGVSLWVGCQFVSGVWVCEWGVSLWVGCRLS